MGPTVMGRSRQWPGDIRIRCGTGCSIRAGAHLEVEVEVEVDPVCIVVCAVGGSVRAGNKCGEGSSLEAGSHLDIDPVCVVCESIRVM